MPRPPRISLEDALYYITSRCIYNQDIFKEDSDYHAYFELLKKYKEQYKFKLYAYVLMPSHFHLLLELPGSSEGDLKGGISEIMHGLNSSYTKYFNGKYGRKGHLFRDRFKTALVEKDPYLLKLTAYIHLNPAKLNLVLSAKDYPYSSYYLYIDKETPMREFMQEEKNIVLGLLGEKTYEQFMQELIKTKDLDLHNDLQKKGILGGTEFQSRVRAELDNKEEKEEEKTDEIESRESTRGPGLKVGTTVLFIALVGLGLTLVARFTLRENKPSGLKGPQVAVSGENKPEFFDPDKISAVKKITAEQAIHSAAKPKDVLEGTTWQITLRPISGGDAQSDTLDFAQKKFVSAVLQTKKFLPSNYSLRGGEGGKIIWETMQSSPEGIALWRADINPDGTMRGILSLRKEGLAVQDFTFTGEYWREK
jgi:putative transposase